MFRSIYIPQTTKGSNTIPKFIKSFKNGENSYTRTNIGNSYAKKFYSGHPFAKKSEGYELDVEEQHEEEQVTNHKKFPIITNYIEFVNTKNTLLGRASEEGDLSMVKKHVETGADIHFNNNYALRWACRNGHFDVVKYLVENGANIYADNNEPLQWASINNHLDIIEYLVERDIDKKLVIC